MIGKYLIAAATLTLPLVVSAQTERGPRTQPETEMGMYAPSQHELYDGRFIVEGSRIYQVGTLGDESPWDHMGDDATNLRPVHGNAIIDVDEIANTGIFRADLTLPEGAINPLAPPLPSPFGSPPWAMNPLMIRWKVRPL